MTIQQTDPAPEAAATVAKVAKSPSLLDSVTSETESISKAQQRSRFNWQLAKNAATSSVIPEAFQRRPDNLFVAMEIADRLRLGWFEVTQHLFIVKGTPTFSAKYMIALANTVGPFDGPLRFEILGQQGEEGFAARAYGKLADGETVERIITYEQAVAARWIYGKGNSLKPVWAAIPDQMLCYRAATALIRLYCPEVTLGMRTTEEARDEYVFSQVAESAVDSPAPERPAHEQINETLEQEAEPDDDPTKSDKPEAKPEPEAKADDEAQEFTPEQLAEMDAEDAAERAAIKADAKPDKDELFEGDSPGDSA